MKHCPNPACPFLQEHKMVAEFYDEVDVCPDCGATLVAGEAPDVAPTPTASGTTPSAEQGEIVSLCAFAALEDADYYKAQLEEQGIPVTLVHQKMDEADITDGGEVEQFELRVLRPDLMRANYWLDVFTAAEEEELPLGDDEFADPGFEENLSEDEAADELVEAEQIAAEMTGPPEASATQPIAPPGHETNNERVVTAQAKPVVQTPVVTPPPATVETAGSTNRWLLLLGLIVIILLIALWLWSRMA